ncbi:MAG TPA: hypothetical protein VHO95_05340, partial [Candidatus Dormibacteraeota bacterium]|nr:hypothetical protein [Candidatus Dormibacteraeota bacterium]
PGDRFLATPGYRESTRWISGTVPADGLMPGEYYHLLADGGIVGELVGDAPAGQAQPAAVHYLGAVCGERGETLNIRQFAVRHCGEPDRNAPIYVLLGTSGDVGKTTAGIAVLRTLQMKGHATVVALKATGTASVEELEKYRDFGAAEAFDCVDFGLPTTYPSGCPGITDIFAEALDFCLALPAEAVVIECGGDLFGANVPEFLACLKARRPEFTIVVAAADALGAMGAKRVLAETGLAISLITGPCTDTPAMRDRTQALCGVPALNLLRGADRQTRSSLPGATSIADP